MVKIFGKILKIKKIIILFLLINSLAVFCDKLELKILSTDGSKLEKAGVGVPFFLEVSGEGLSNLNELKINGLQDFTVNTVGIKSVSINGNITSSRSFYVKIEKPGKYKIGPAKIQENGTDYESVVIELEVANEQIASDEQVGTRNSRIGRVKDSKEGQSVFLKLLADKEAAVFGEKINCKVRFYYLDGQEIKIDGIILPNIKDCKILEGSNLADPTIGSQQIDGKLYNYEQWVFTIVAKKTGKISVPAFRGVYIGVEEGPFGWPVFQPKNVYSNALSFNIEPLPKYDGVVDAVGKFICFEASVDRVVAKQGDGIVYTLELEGLGDLESIEFKDLKNMPKELKYYDSKRYLLDNSAKEGMRKKRFEFIIQGLQEGEMIIPIQTFTFFDTQTRQYKVLRSSSVKLNILPVSGGALIGDLGNKNEHLKPVNLKRDFVNNKGNLGIFTINQSGVWFAVKEKKIDWRIFWFLIFMPIFLLCTVFLKKLKFALSRSRFSRNYAQNSIKKSSFAHALRDLDIARTRNNFVGLYSIFITLFSERFNFDESFVTDEKIKEILINNNFSQKDLLDWDIFVGKIMEYAFCDKDKAGKFELAIFAQAVYWVDKFKQKFNN